MTLVAFTLLVRALKSLKALIQISLVIIKDPANPTRKLDKLIANQKNKKIIKILSASGSKISPI